MPSQFSFSSARLRRVQKLQFGILSPDEVVSKWLTSCCSVHFVVWYVTSMEVEYVCVWCFVSS